MYLWICQKNRGCLPARQSSYNGAIYGAFEKDSGMPLCSPIPRTYFIVVLDAEACSRYFMQ
ncbi:hypothetical protein PORCRE_831 [Porphyromonas crevioricanis JCM 15906]|uniref:Uncharacterized protein n=1 Tax=Porphyromonas crevioricanis JCM 15906 TaxID=1305617 RepID=T1CH37_9PORP|nr:hypothetical protein PORCRE_831 [Porphyromonas crevioricanis JCM 15906]